jgi:hypothetical protein
MPSGRPSLKNTSFWKTQLAQYDPANYGTELQYHQVFAEKFTKSFDKLKPSVKKFISAYYASHRSGVDDSKKAAFYRLHPDLYPDVDPAPSKGPDPNVAFQQASSDIQIARGKRPDHPGQKRKWGEIDVNAPSEQQFVSNRKKDLLLSLTTEPDVNPSDDPSEKQESKEDAFALNHQQNTSLAPESHNQDPGQMSRGQRETAAIQGARTVGHIQLADEENQLKKRVQDQIDIKNAERMADPVPANRKKMTQDEQTKFVKKIKAQAIQDVIQSNPTQDDIYTQQMAKFDVGPTSIHTPSTTRQTETENVRGGNSSDSVTREAFAQFGDALLDTETVDTATPSMRPQYGMEGASAVVPSTAKQLASDLGFDMFSWVNRGYGNGSDNKLYLQQEAHEKLVRYAGDMYGPGAHPGPIGGIAPMPMGWAPVKPSKFINHTHRKFNRNNRLCMNLYNSAAPQNGTALALPDDIGSPHMFSSQELPRKMNSPLEPVYNNYSVFQSVRDAAGMDRKSSTMARSLHDPVRNPYNQPSDTQHGIPHLSRRLGMQEILR